MMADSDHDAGAAAGIERGLRIGFGEREWLFAINMLAGSRNGFDLRTMSPPGLICRSGPHRERSPARSDVRRQSHALFPAQA